MGPSAFHNRRLSAVRPFEHIDGQCVGSHIRVAFPELVTLVDLLLIGFGLVACEVREDAGKGHLHKSACSIRPLELAKKILNEACTGLIAIDTRPQVYLSGENSIVLTDPGIAFVESL